MTLREVVDQVYSLSIGGFFNRQKVTKKWLYNYLNTLLRTKEKVPQRVVMEIALPDGWFYFSVNSFIDGGCIGFDYFIPDTKEQSEQLFQSLVSG